MLNFLNNIQASKIYRSILKFRTTLAISSFLLIVFYIYQPCYLDYARRDHIIFIIDRNDYKNDIDWFKHALSYTRNRKTSPGDYFLYRPGFYFLLAVNDIFLRTKPFITGMLSIALHLTTILLLYFIFCRYFNKELAFPFSAIFASQYMGIEMIAWRHISFYMLSAILTILSFLLLSSKIPKKHLLAGLLLFLGMTFHEIIPVSAILLSFLLSITFILFGWNKFQNNSITTKFLFVLISAFSLYFLINFLNWRVTHPPSFLGPADHFSLKFNFFKNAALNFFHYLAVSTKAVFFPFSMPLGWEKSLDDWAYFSWDISKDNVFSCFAWALLAFVLLVLAVSISLRKISILKDNLSEILTLWSCCGILLLTLMYSFMRLSLRNTGYSLISTYYYWFFALFYSIITLYLINHAIQKITSANLKKTIILSLYCLSIFFTVLQCNQARDTLTKNYDLVWAQQINQAIDTSELFFKIHPDTCLDSSDAYLGVPPRKQQYFTIPYYLYKYRCGWNQGTTTVHLMRTINGITYFESGPFPNK